MTGLEIRFLELSPTQQEMISMIGESTEETQMPTMLSKLFQQVYIVFFMFNCIFKTFWKGFKAAWVASSTLLGTSPGDSSGLATESDHNAPKCPHYTTGSWSVFLQSTGSSVDDSTFTITCADCTYYDQSDILYF